MGKPSTHLDSKLYPHVIKALEGRYSVMFSGLSIVELVGFCWDFLLAWHRLSQYCSLHFLKLWSVLGAQGSAACCVCNSEGQQNVDE